MGLRKIAKIFMYLQRIGMSFLMHYLTPIHPKRIIFWSYHFTSYSCNPRVLSDFILQNYPEYEVYWAFAKTIVIPKDLNPQIKTVRFGTWSFYKILYSSTFVITNTRIYFDVFFKKRSRQIYLQTWHSSMKLKRVEKDIEEELSKRYIRSAKFDGKQLDYILSGSGFASDVIKRAFWIEPEKVLEYGTPRNDLFFQKNESLKEKVFTHFSIPLNNHTVLYAPTFRKQMDPSIYLLNFERIKEALAQHFGGNWSFLVRLHPNFLDKQGSDFFKQNESVIDATRYPEMQELLASVDVLITDYSSSMFDFSLTKRACFLYAPDYKEYDRGFYLDIKKLPFPFSINERNLYENITCFNFEQYKMELNKFIYEFIRTFEEGKAAASIWKVLFNTQKELRKKTY